MLFRSAVSTDAGLLDISRAVHTALHTTSAQEQAPRVALHKAQLALGLRAVHQARWGRKCLRGRFKLNAKLASNTVLPATERSKNTRHHCRWQSLRHGLRMRQDVFNMQASDHADTAVHGWQGASMYLDDQSA